MFLSPNLLRFANDKCEKNPEEKIVREITRSFVRKEHEHMAKKMVKINQKRSHNVSRSAPVPADLRLFLQPSLDGPVNIPATFGKLFFLLDE